MIPRTHFLQCEAYEFEETKDRLEHAGFAVYEPVYSQGKANITYMRKGDFQAIPRQNVEAVHNIGMKNVGPGSDSGSDSGY